MRENDIECEFFTVISIDSLLLYDKKNFAYKIIRRQMTNYPN